MPSFFSVTNKVRFIGVLLLAVVAGGATVYIAMQYQKAHAPKNSVLSAQTEVVTVVANVGKLMELPQNEVPTIATVTDITKLKGQTFFTNAKNGDKVLFYTNAKEAILFRPMTNKLVNVQPLVINNTVSPVPSLAVSSIKIALYNGAGTKSADLVTSITNQIQTTVSNATITTTQDAASSDYIKNLVVNLTGKYPNTARQLGKLFQARVTTKLPQDETKPDADILIIAGEK